MQFTIWCKEEGADDASAWSEAYNKPVSDAQKWAEATIDRFNDTLRSHEKPRVLLRVEVAPNDERLQHDWRKSSLVTEVHGQRMFDRYRCTQCGATGKRHGVNEVRPDSGTPKWCHPERPRERK
jgi:hypothetical protein